MNAVKLPRLLSFGKKYGLLISDTDVNFVSWKNGNLENIAAFANEDAGVTEFTNFLDTHGSAYKNKPIHVLTNIIGEDYRFERVAHLLGKYKVDFHRRRMAQLFRESELTLSLTQGREEHGRREDLVLFYGLLTEAKVLPWLSAVARPESGRYLAGVHAVAFVSAPILKQVAVAKKGNNTILVTLHEKGLMRQVFYAGTHMRFSRVSKLQDDSPERMAASIRKELERTLKNLAALKVSLLEKIDAHVICPGGLIGQLSGLLTGSNKIDFTLHDAASVARGMGLKSSIDELGRDSSLALAAMFSILHFRQLASFARVQYYWMKAGAAAAVLLLIFYGLFASIPLLTNFWDAQEVAEVNARLEEQRNLAQKNYDEQTGLDDPPSTPENIEATSRVFRLVSNMTISPSQLIYYFARGFELNRKLGLDGIRWYLTDNPEGTVGASRSMFFGGDLYQVLEVRGVFLPIPNETYINVAERAERLLNSFEERPDMRIIPVQMPSPDLPSESLSGVISGALELEAARDRAFTLRLVWKSHEAGYLERFVGQI